MKNELKMDQTRQNLQKAKDIKWLMIMLYFLCPYVLCFIAEMLCAKEYAFLINVLKGFCVIMPLVFMEKTELCRLWYLRFKKLIYDIFDVGKFARRFVRSGDGIDLAFC